MFKYLKRTLIGISCALALYSWLGFLLIPSVGLSLINQQLEHYSSEPATLQRLELNPFTLRLDLWQLHIGAERTVVAFEHLHTKLAWDSLWTAKLHIDSVTLTQPSAHLAINPEGEVNLTQLLLLPETQKTQTPAAEPLAVHIENITVEQGKFSFSDQRPRQPVTLEFAQLNAQVDNLNTALNEQGQVQLSLEASDGTQLNWQGDLSLQPLRSSGHIELSNIALNSWWPYVAEQTQLELDSGLIALSSDYQVEAQPDWQFSTHNSSIEIKELGLSSQQQPLLQLAHLSVSDTSANMQQQSLHIGKIRSNNLASWINIDAEGELNWLQALAPRTKNQSAPSEPVSDTTASVPANQVLVQLPWQIKLDSAQLSNYSVEFNDASRHTPVAIKLEKLALEVTDFDSRAESPATLALNSQVGAEGQVALKAQIKPHNLHTEIQLSTSAIDLHPAQSWITDYARVELRSGMLNSNLTAQLDQLEPLQFNAQGELSISQLHLRDQGQHRDLLKWNNLHLQDIALSQTQQTQLKIGRITANQPYARFVIDENLSTNISKILVEQPDAQNTTAEDTTTNTFAFNLGEVLIEDGSAHFSDFSLTPHFATAIQNLNGRIGSLDSQLNTATPIEITGAVDRYAPVTIKGSLAPFDPLQNLDIDVSFKQVELTTLTPYSGKFAGYRIHKGRLNLALNYQIEQGQLNAKNSVLLEDLQLGDAVKSPDAVKLPLRLAVALLKDNKGNIDIKLPVKGDLNDPEFSVAPIVWQTLRNLITRAVSAPFKLLGNLASGSHDLSQVSYAAGQSNLTEQAQQTLTSLAQALQKRPQLKLNIEGTSSGVFDGPLMAQKYLHYRMQELHYSELQERGKKLPESIHQLELSDRQQDKLLEQLYHELPEPAKLADELPRKKAERLPLMQQQWVAHHATNTLLLRTLAQNRAKAIRQYLAENEQIDPKRLFLIDVNENAGHDKQGISSLLHLDAL